MSLPPISVAQISPPFSASPGSQAQVVQGQSPAPLTAVSAAAIAPELPAVAPASAPGLADSFIVSEPDAGLAHSKYGKKAVSQEIGEATRDLLTMQANMNRAGPAHHVLGATAGRTWQRYLDSFEYPIPKKFDVEVENGSSR